MSASPPRLGFRGLSRLSTSSSSESDVFISASSQLSLPSLLSEVDAVDISVDVDASDGSLNTEASFRSLTGVDEELRCCSSKNRARWFAMERLLLVSSDSTELMGMLSFIEVNGTESEREADVDAGLSLDSLESPM